MRRTLTRFAWIARAGGAPSPVGGAPGRTALVFWGGGDRAPGWLVDCLTELSSRGVNLTRIESRPRRVGLGHYMFFCDLDGAAEDPSVAAAIDGAAARHCERVRILGIVPAGAVGRRETTVATSTLRRSHGHRHPPSTGVRAARRPPPART